MKRPDDIQVIFCSVPDAGSGERIARYLVEHRLVACVNVIPGITSVYRWEGKVTADSEALLKIKATAGSYQAIETAIRSQHPYELPEIIAVPVSNGWSEYLDWIRIQHDEAL
ncbi:Periplasmic divalent cation tolerance protein CutA [hydrothermal vent metagenome]|uniref:Periplasmic divalent cation tolerance protein CutA n=1 Tax=hydrothermal vent metagenome TaxID=652676 RepID=A0A3B0Y5X0_9ZZZZ